MPVYWSMLIVTVIIGVLCYSTPMKKMAVGNNSVYRVKTGFVVVLISYIVFFVGFRDKVLDTSTYIMGFQNLPLDLEGLSEYVADLSSGKGFYYIEGLFKIFISQEYYVWHLFLALISCACLFKTLYKYSVDFPLSAYLFIADTTFTWLLNGSRQFLAVCILFGAVDWLLEGKKWHFILLALVLTTIHSSVIFLVIIVFFVDSKKILPKTMWIFVALTIIGTQYSEYIFEFLSETSDALDYSAVLNQAGGSNIIRLFVAAIPMLILCFNYRHVKAIAPPSIRLAINMNMVGICFYFASTFTNGILIGRMPIYFTIYSLYLLPWEISNCFTEKSKKIVWILCAGCYLVYFYYQMCIAWGGLMYVSDILNIGYY